MTQDRGGWTTKKSEQKYKNHWIEVVEDAVINDKGKELIYGVVKIVKGSCVLPLDDAGYVYLARQFRYGLGDFSTEGPGGGFDEGDSPLVTAKRELKEELGISPKEWIDLGHVNPLTGVIKHTEYLFLARGFEAPKQIPQSKEETIERVRIPLHEAAQMVMDSKITHAPSAVLILKAQKYLAAEVV
ncbi:MAG: NUDIX hydrolase [Patescibacteria group bacterium]